MYFLTKRYKRRHFQGVQEARKVDDLGPHTPAPETGTNFCSFAKRFIKIGSKSKKLQPKSTGQLENSRPLWTFLNLGKIGNFMTRRLSLREQEPKSCKVFRPIRRLSFHKLASLKLRIYHPLHPHLPTLNYALNPIFKGGRNDHDLFSKSKVFPS